MATKSDLTADSVDDGEWVLFWTLAIVVLYFTILQAIAVAEVVLL